MPATLVERFRREFARVGLVERYRFDPGQHPRGQPENAGQFVESGSASGKAKQPLHADVKGAVQRATVRGQKNLWAGWRDTKHLVRYLEANPDTKQPDGSYLIEAAEGNLQIKPTGHTYAPWVMRWTPAEAAAANAPAEKSPEASPEKPAEQPAEPPATQASEPEQSADKGADKYGPGVQAVGGNRFVGVTQMRVADLKAAPSRFQYKFEGIDSSTGTNDELKSTGRFRPEFGGQLLVWHDPKDNQVYVVNGHHRYELARRSGYGGYIPVFLIDAKDDKQARAVGAMANIAEGRGTALDAAKFFRESGMGPAELADEGISLKGKIADDGVAMSHLSDRLFREVASGRMRQTRALYIARELGDHPDLQDQLASKLSELDDRGRDVPDSLVFEMARKIKDSNKQKVTTKSLFGDEEQEVSTFYETCSVQAAVRKELAERATAFKAVSGEERAGRLAEAGNVIHTEENRSRAQAAKSNVWLFDKLVNTKGELADAFNEFGQQLFATPRDKRRIVADAVGRAEAILSAFDQGGKEGGGETRGGDSGVSAGGGTGGQGGEGGVERFDRSHAPASLAELFAAEFASRWQPLAYAAGREYKRDTGGRFAPSGSRPAPQKDAVIDQSWRHVKPAHKPLEGQKELFMQSALSEKFAREFARRGYRLRYSRDASGHEHKGKGPGGGQFTSTSTGDEGEHPRDKGGVFSSRGPSKGSPVPDGADSGQQSGQQSGRSDLSALFKQEFDGRNAAASPSTGAAAPPATGSGPDGEETTAPPPGPMFSPNPGQINPQTGTADAARVGVPGAAVPPPPKKIPRLPNLSQEERAAESRFADAFEANPDGLADQYMAKVYGSKSPTTFETDAAKELSDDWMQPGQPEEAQKAARARFNTALHQTANAIAKRAFVKHLDKIAQMPPEQRHVLVTAGGCGAGKGYALANVDETANLSKAAAGVWDSAGDQNSTELPWLTQECKKRGIKLTAAYVHNVPEGIWTNPERGVVQRANKQGRMVDARVFADSHTHGARNFAGWAGKVANDPDVNVIYLDNSTGVKPQRIQGIPPEALNRDPDELYNFAANHLKTAQVNPNVMAGGLAGERLWGK